MKRFKTFVKETIRPLFESKKLAASGKDAQRHTEKYILPHAIGKTSDVRQFRSALSLNRDVSTGRNTVNAGAKLHPIAGTHRIINGVHHSDFHAVSGKTAGIIRNIPHSAVTPETSSTGKHVDEHAVIKIWNHFASSHRGRHPEIHEMHNELSKAKIDLKHPLHIANAKKSEFQHGVNGYNDAGSEDVKKRATSTYYKNLEGASHTLHAMINHRDFNTNWKNGDELESAGRSRPELSDLYKNAGVKGGGATSKSDVITIKPRNPQVHDYRGVKMVSLKDSKGSQIFSSSPAEFHGIYQHSLNALRKGRKIGDQQHKNGSKTVLRIKEHLENGNHRSADDLLQNLHNNLNKHGLLRAVHREGFTGEGKFKTSEGTATHIATIGKGATVQRVDEFLDKYEPIFKNPQAGAGKDSNRSTAVRLRLDGEKALHNRLHQHITSPGSSGISAAM